MGVLVKNLSQLRLFAVLALVGLVSVEMNLCARAQVVGQEVTLYVHHLPKLMARTKDPSDILLTSLHTILNDNDVCCGEDSALGDAVQEADPGSLKDIAEKLNGRHLLGDGRPIMVTTEYLPTGKVSAGHLIKMIEDQHAALLLWNSHLYVVNGVVYVPETTATEDAASTSPVIRKLLLIDPRYSDARRNAEFNRETDDVNKVQGLLFIETKPQQ